MQSSSPIPIDPPTKSLTERYRVAGAFGLLTLALAAAFLASLAHGPASVPIDRVVAILLGNAGDEDRRRIIVMDFRLPKAITAVAAGAALAIAGLLMQTLFRNPLAGPYVLGIDSGAMLGVALVTLTARLPGSLAPLAGGEWSRIGSATLGAAAVLCLVLAVTRRLASHVAVLVLGLMIAYLVSAGVGILMFHASADSIQLYQMWSFGSFSSVGWNRLGYLLPPIGFGAVAAWLCAKPLNALQLPDAYARSLGVNVARARLQIVLVTSVLAGAITAFCGPIIFLGLAVPHIARGWTRSADHQVLVPAAAIAGATLALLTDLLCQWPGSQLSLPLNSMMALLGAPVVIWIILGRSRTIT